MSHFVRCDRCTTEDAVMGTISLPPGWQKICGADLCEPCCQMVREFIRFTSADASALPVEPIPAGPVKEELFEEEPCATPVVCNAAPTTDSLGAAATGAPIQPAGIQTTTNLTTTPTATKTTPSNPEAEASTEERARTRKVKQRTSTPPPSAQPGAPA